MSFGIQVRNTQLGRYWLERYRLQNAGSKDVQAFATRARAWIATCLEMLKVSYFYNSEEAANCDASRRWMSSLQRRFF